jgi:sec-independent protein translocase protein TatB
MNPGIGVPELLVLLVLALVVVGPKDLPLMVRRIGQFVGRMRGLARDFQRSFDELGREAELAELRKEVDALKRANPISEVKREFETAERDALRDPVEDKPHPRVAAKAKPATATPPPPSEPADGASEQKSG